jgi:hypothetical protein
MNQTNLPCPPLPPVPPDWWELHGIWVIIGAVALATCLGLIGWAWRRRAITALGETPAGRARRELTTQDTATTGGLALSRASRIVRRYLIDRLSLPRREMTTAEFCRELEMRVDLAPDLRDRIGRFLRDGDTLKFAPAPDDAQLDALRGSALQLVNDTEAALTPSAAR